MTTKGFRTRWRKAKASYRNATGGRKNAERKKLVLLVAEELKREMVQVLPQVDKGQAEMDTKQAADFCYPRGFPLDPQVIQAQLPFSDSTDRLRVAA